MKQAALFRSRPDNTNKKAMDVVPSSTQCSEGSDSSQQEDCPFQSEQLPGKT